MTSKNGNLSFSKGELLCLGAAVSYAIAILITDRLTKQDDPVMLGILQNGFMGIFSLPASFVFEQPSIPASPRIWASIAALVIFCTVLEFTLQPIAQKYTTAERAGLLCALSPLFSLILGILFLHEHFDLNGVIGAVLIIGSIVVSQLFDKRRVLCDENNNLPIDADS